MIRRLTKAAVGVLAASIVFSSIGIDVSAEGNTSAMAGGGIGLMLAQGGKYENPSAESILPLDSIIEWASLNEVLDTNSSEEELFRNLVIAQVRTYVNVRSIPSEKGEIVGKLYNNSVGTFLGEEDGWYQINSGSVTGYVKAEYCVTGDEAVEIARKVGTRMATVDTQTLFVRSEPSLEASRLGIMLPRGEELLVLDEVEGWAKVDLEGGTGWVSTDYVILRTDFVQAESKAEEEARLAKEAAERQKARAAAAAAAPKTTTSNPAATKTEYTVTGDSEMGIAVAEYALQFVGNPYVYGGTSLTNGADCSGFVMSVYANFGIKLPRTSAADRSQGSAVDGLENAQPGDLICYSGHVALYIGNGQIVHASNSKTGIIVSNASYRKILAIRRIL